MKTITMICVAAALCVPALASAQRGGGAGAIRVQRVDVGRVDVRRIDTMRTITPGRDVNIARGVAVIDTGTRIRRPDPDRRRLHHARRRWNAAHPPGPNPARRRWNAAHPSDSDSSPRREHR
jgi:hypothetical protein